MGKVESKSKTNRQTKITVSSKIKREFNCPLCFKKFTGNMTYLQLNQHLFRCGNIRGKYGSSMNIKLDMIPKNSFSESPIQQNKYKEISERLPPNKLGKFYSNNIDDNNFVFIEEKGNNNNNLKKEQNKEIKILSFDEKYNNLKDYVSTKKKHMNQNQIINGSSYDDLFEKLKFCNIYLNLQFCLNNSNNDFTENNNNDNNIINDNNISLSTLVNKYFENRIKLNKFNIINGKSLAFSFSSNIDFELLGYILAFLFIYFDFKLNYKLPQLICKIIVDENLSLNDIQYENKKLYDDLIKIRGEENISDLNLFFISDGIELVEDGHNIRVNENNLDNYIDKMINFEIEKYKKETKALRDALFQFLPKDYILNFSGEEIYQILNRMV